jgi:DNA polymerase-3 subunit alpha
MQELTEAVTHFSGQLADVSSDEKVRVAGLITRIRHHQSKAGKPMAFATIEDLQGAIELVIFPRTWSKCSELIQMDKIVLVEGRVDGEGAEPKVLVDNVSTEFSMVTSIDRQPDYLEYLAPDEPSWNEPDPFQPSNSHAVHDAPINGEPGSQMSREPAGKPSNKTVPHSGQGEDAPPPPDAFPPDWDHAVDQLYETVSFVVDRDSRVMESEPVAAKAKIESEPSDNQPIPEAQQVVPPADHAAQATVISASPAAPVVKTENAAIPVAQDQSRFAGYLVSPTAVVEDENGTVRMLTIALRSTGDKTRDVLRLRRIHGMITTFPGNDRFAFHVFERGRGYLLEFPNFTFGLNPELFERLKGLLGAENLRVETITFQ